MSELASVSCLLWWRAYTPIIRLKLYELFRTSMPQTLFILEHFTNFTYITKGLR